MRASTNGPDGKGTSTADVIARETGELTIPIREPISVSESICLGFRQEMLSVGEGSVSTGGGLGTDFIELEWGDKRAMIRGSEILKAWVATFSPEDAERFPKDVR